MRKSILTFLFLFVAACSAENTKVSPEIEASQEVSADARLAAVLVYADWCSSCKIIDPKIQAAKEQGPINGVSFVTLDYTKRDVDGFFTQADTLGVGEAIRGQLNGDVTTGILLLVDLDDKKVVADLRKELSAEEIRAAIERAAANA